MVTGAERDKSEHMLCDWRPSHHVFRQTPAELRGPTRLDVLKVGALRRESSLPVTWALPPTTAARICPFRISGARNPVVTRGGWPCD